MSTCGLPTRPLRALAEVALGRMRSPDRAEGPNMVPYLRAANVKDGSLDLSDVKSMDFNPSEQVTYRLRPGDVLVTEGAGSLAAVGASAVWSGEIEGVVCFQNTLLRLRPRGDTNARYLMWWARHAYGSGLLASVAQGANIFHLGADNVRLLPASIPDPSVQRAIADYLDTETARIDAVVEQRRAQLVAFRDRLASEVERRVLGFLGTSRRASQPSPFFQARPIAWRETTLRHLGVEVQTGPFGSQLHAAEYVEGGTPIINPMHLMGRCHHLGVTQLPQPQRHTLARNDIEEGT